VRISKRLIKRIAIGFGLLLGLLLIINSVLAWSAQRRLDQKIAELRAAGEPVSLADLAPTPIPPEKNAAVYLRQMAADAQRFNQEWDKVFYKTPLEVQLGPVEENDLLPDEKLKAVMRPLINAHPLILPTLENAAACSQYASLLDFSLPPRQFLESMLASVNSSEPRSVAQFVRWNMVVLVADGKRDEAVRLGIRMLRLARFHDQEPSLMNFLVSTSVRGIIFSSINLALQQNQVDPGFRAELDAELALHDSLGPLQAALRSERAFAIPYVTEQIGVIPGFVRWPALNWMLGELDAEDQAYGISKLPLNQIAPVWNPTSKRFEFPKLAGIRSRLIWAAVEASFIAEFRTLAQCRCLRVLNAIGEYRARTGKEAESIQQLSLPREAIIDPCTGKPLGMKKTDAGWIVYSNHRGIDDGGKYHSEDGPWGFGPPGYEHNETK
jgi:hypothetical protein